MPHASTLNQEYGFFIDITTVSYKYELLLTLAPHDRIRIVSKPPDNTANRLLGFFYKINTKIKSIDNWHANNDSQHSFCFKCRR